MSNREVKDYEVDDREEELSEVDMPETIQDEGVQEIEEPVSLEYEIEMAVEDFDRILENISPLKKAETETEIPDVWWHEDIEKIEDPNIQNKEIEEARKWKADENERVEKYIFENKDFKGFGAENPDLTRKGIKIATRCALESEGITYDHLGDLSEDARHLQSGDLETVEAKDRVKRLLSQVDPEVGEELAEKVIEEHELSGDDAESLRRLIRLREMGGK
jgi:hypothetical protein